MFRHRYFELGGGFSMVEMYCNGSSAPGGDHFGQRVAGVRHGITYEGNMLAIYGDGGGKGSFDEWAEAMGIDWIAVGSMKERKRSIAEAIPPVYSSLVGGYLMAHIGRGFPIDVPIDIDVLTGEEQWA
jgi:DNA (cytosine-5)-methyltransferase 1